MIIKKKKNNNNNNNNTGLFWYKTSHGYQRERKK